VVIGCVVESDDVIGEEWDYRDKVATCWRIDTANPSSEVEESPIQLRCYERSASNWVTSRNYHSNHQPSLGASVD
jgi:hypothetical protein